MSIKNKLIKLAYSNPELRAELLPLIKKMGLQIPAGSAKPRVLMVMFPDMWNITEDELAGLRSMCDLKIHQTKHITEIELAAMCEGYDYLMLNMDALPAYPDRMEKLTEKFYNHPGVTGLKSINTDMTDADFFSPELAKTRGIVIQDIPNTTTRSVAESAVTEMLLHSRKRHAAYMDLVKGREVGCTVGMNLEGKTVGIIGFGNIGQTVAKILTGMGMKILANDLSPITVPGFQNTPIDEIFRTADVITLHIPAHQRFTNVSNVGMINGSLLNLCKGTILVNLATDIIVDHKSMVDAIKSGKIIGYSVEPGRAETSKFSKYEQVHLSPCSYDSPESREHIKKGWIENMISAIQGNPNNAWE